MCIGRWNSHLFTLSNTTQGPLHVTLTLWYEREWRGCGSMKEDLRWIDSDYRILSLSWVKRSSTKTPQSSDICTSKVQRRFTATARFQPPWKKKKKKNFPLMSGHSQPRGILRISEALFFPPSCVFGQRGSDNILAQEQNCNIRQVSGQSLTLFSHWLR